MIQPSHFTAVLLFALFASTCLRHHPARNPAAHVPLRLYCFSLFVGSAIVLSWVMFLIAR